MSGLKSSPSRDDTAGMNHMAIDTLHPRFSRRTSQKTAVPMRVTAKIMRLNEQAVDHILAARREPDPARRELRYEAALELLEQAEALQDGNTATCTNQGALFCDMSGGGQKSKQLRKWAARWAHTALSRAIRSGSSDANTFYNMSIVLMRLGHGEAARGHLETAAQLEPDPDTVAALTNVEALEAFRPSRSNSNDTEAGEKPESTAPRQLGKPASAKTCERELNFQSRDVVVPRGDEAVIEWVLGFVEDEKPIVALVDRLVLAAQRLEAKAMTLEPDDGRFRVGFTRSDAEIREWEFPESWSFDSQYHMGVIARIMITAHQDVTRRDAPQQSECTLETTLGAIHLVVSTNPSPDGTRVVLQL